jgi:16S rRNA (adenine1518-N6/adenine1519-N6)-dimethyltransferase
VTASIPGLLRSLDLHPRKRLGQNFLTDPVALGRIVGAADLSQDDTVLEVGAGLGTLTRLLAERAGHVVAVELDDRLVEILREHLYDQPGVQIIHGDILKITDFGFAHRGFKVVANLPYYLTSAILRRCLEKEPRPRLMVVTVQHEVAKRIVAKPGKMSLLAVSVQLFGKARIVSLIPPGAFYPQPKVHSAVLRIDVHEQPTVSLAEACDEAAFFRVVRAGFGQRRKTLRNSLSGGLGLPPKRVEDALTGAGVDPQRRAQTLSLQEWADVTEALSGWLAQLQRHQP